LCQTVSDDPPTDDALRAYNKTVRKVTEDLDRHAFNTVISALMIGVNELTDAGGQSASILKPLAILVSPVAPHLAEELFQMAGGTGLVVSSEWPEWDEQWLTSDHVTYPVSFNGKVRFQMEAATSADKQEVETQVLADERTVKQLEGKVVRKIIVVPGRIINIVAN